MKRILEKIGKDFSKKLVRNFTIVNMKRRLEKIRKEEILGKT